MSRKEAPGRRREKCSTWSLVGKIPACWQGETLFYKADRERECVLCACVCVCVCVCACVSETLISSSGLDRSE